MKNLTRKTFKENGVFVVPAGVRKIKTIAKMKPEGMGVAMAVGKVVNTFLIDNANRLLAVGGSLNGQLGDSSVTAKSSPVLIASDKRWLRVIPYPKASGGAIDGSAVYAQDEAGVLWAWGTNQDGQIGIGNTTAQSSPVLVAMGNGARLKKIFAGITNGFSHAPAFVLALDVTGKAWAWGSQRDTNILGIGSDFGTTVAVSSPTAVIGGHIFTELFCTIDPTQPAAQAWGLDANGALWAWGMKADGSLGNGASGSRPTSSPTLVLGPTIWKKVFPQFSLNTEIRNFFLDSSDNLWASGKNTAGCLGADLDPASTSAVSSPVMVVGGIKFAKLFEKQATSLLSVNASIVAIDKVGKAYAWGDNTQGCLGVGANPVAVPMTSSPTLISSSIRFSRVLALTAADFSGLTSFLGLSQDGKVYGWGSNGDGILGTNDLISRSSPVLVTFPAGFGRIEDVQTCYGAILCLDNKGNLYSWGSSAFGQLGDGVTSGALTTSSPVAVVGGKYFTKIFTSSINVFALESSGNLY